MDIDQLSAAVLASIADRIQTFVGGASEPAMQSRGRQHSHNFCPYVSHGDIISRVSRCMSFQLYCPSAVTALLVPLHLLQHCQASESDPLESLSSCTSATSAFCRAKETSSSHCGWWGLSRLNSSRHDGYWHFVRLMPSLSVTS